jgi:hypothetical protein
VLLRRIRTAKLPGKHRELYSHMGCGLRG